MSRDAFREMLQSVSQNGYSFGECKQVLHDSRYDKLFLLFNSLTDTIDIELDPGFKEFYAYSKLADIPVIIVSRSVACSPPLLRTSTDDRDSYLVG